MLNSLLLLWFAAATGGQTIDELVIPRKTEIFVTLERRISTKTAAAGDKFYGRIAVPITQNDQVVIPVGSYVIGHIDSAREAGRVRGKASLALKFDTIILPNGTTREMRAVLSSAEGYETAPPSEEGSLEGEGVRPEDVARGAVTGASIGTTVGVVGTRSLKGAGIGAGAGAATGAVIGALRKNQEVDLPRGSSITVVLDTDVRFVRPGPDNPRDPL
jgi:hypothetical protein